MESAEKIDKHQEANRQGYADVDRRVHATRAGKGEHRSRHSQGNASERDPHEPNVFAGKTAEVCAIRLKLHTVLRNRNREGDGQQNCSGSAKKRQTLP